MLSNSEHPVAWAMLVYELGDAHEHLGELIERMCAEGTVDEEEYRIQLGHVFAHLNRAWNGRDDKQLDVVSGELYVDRGKFPFDLSPGG